MSSIKAFHLLRTLAILGAASALAACGTTGTDKTELALSPTQQFPLKATTAPTGIQLQPHAKGLSAAQMDGLRGLVSDWRQAGDGMIVVEIPACACDDAAQAGYDAYDALQAMGVPERSIRLLGYETNPGGPIRVSYQRVRANIEKCNESWGDLTKTGSNRPYANFGCVTNSNIAAMIDNPADILRPRTSDPASSQRRDVVIERYRAGQATSSEKEADSDVSISGVAK